MHSIVYLLILRSFVLGSDIFSQMEISMIHKEIYFILVLHRVQHPGSYCEGYLKSGESSAH